MELGPEARGELHHRQVAAQWERTEGGATVEHCVELAFLLTQLQIDRPVPDGWSAIRAVIEDGLRMSRDEPDLLFNLAFTHLREGNPRAFAKARKRLARHDVVGATVLDAMAEGQPTILDPLLADLRRLSQADDGGAAREALAALGRMHSLVPQATEIATAYGFALVDHGDLERAAEVAASLAHRAGDDDTDHYNAGVLFAIAGDGARAANEFRESLAQGRSPDDRRSAREALARLTRHPPPASSEVEPETAARRLLAQLPFARVVELEWRLESTDATTLRHLDGALAEHASVLDRGGRHHEAELVRLIRELAAAEAQSAARRAAQLAAGVIDLSSFGAGLGDHLDDYLAAADIDAARAIIRAHPALLTPAVVRAAEASVGPSPAELAGGAGRAYLLADAEDVGLARASPTFVHGARERDRPAADAVALPAPGADPDVAIESLRDARADPAFADLTRWSRTTVEAELGKRLLLRAIAEGGLDDLVDAVVLLRRATSTTLDRSYWLAHAEFELHLVTRSDVCLERARFLLGRWIGSLAPDDPRLAQCLVVRGELGACRFERYGRRGDIELALACTEHVIDLLGGPDLEQALELRGRLLQMMAEADDWAATNGTMHDPAAVDDSPERDLIAADGLVLLGSSVDALWSAAGPGVDDAIEQVRQRMSRLRPWLAPGESAASLCEWVDAEAVWCRHRLRPNPSEVRQSAERLAPLGPSDELVRQAVALTLASLLAELGDGDEEAWGRAAGGFRDLIAAHSGAVPPPQWEARRRIAARSARRWGDAAWRRGRWGDAASAYDALLEVRRDSIRTLARPDDQLDTFTGTALEVGRAAWARLHRDDPWGAVVACERGRAVVLTAAMSGRPLGQVFDEDHEELLGAIQDAARPSLLAYVLAGDDSGVALVVDGDDLTVLTLPGLSDRAATDRARQLVLGGPTGPDLLTTTRWLWESGVDRIAEVVADRADLTLVPTGVLSMLPLHAAWQPDDRHPDGRRHLVDIATVRHAPNARVLLAARARLAARGGPYRSALAVYNPAASRLPPLPGAIRETARLAELIDTTRLEGTEATRDGVLGAWDRHDVLHLACHGRALIDEPLRSALLLTGDWPLEVADILDATTVGSPLVVLSACETAIVGRDVPDETVSMQSMFLQTGAHGVVGTMWRVDDGETADLMGRFYAALLSTGRPPAEALRFAQRAPRPLGESTTAPARREVGSELCDPPGTAERDLTWMAFTYTGA